MSKKKERKPKYVICPHCDHLVDMTWFWDQVSDEEILSERGRRNAARRHAEEKPWAHHNSNAPNCRCATCLRRRELEIKVKEILKTQAEEAARTGQPLELILTNVTPGKLLKAR